ncbi:hypothetical protein FQZ97_974270 [compost metagenome]
MLKHRYHVGRLAGVDQRGDHRVGQAVFVAVEIGVVEKVRHPIPGAVVEQQAAEHAGLGFNGVWGDAQLRDLAVGTTNALIQAGIKGSESTGKNGGHRRGKSKGPWYALASRKSWDKSVDKSGKRGG